MNDIDKLMSEPGTNLILAAPHFQLEQASFYSDWALRALEMGATSSSLVKLATLEPDCPTEEIAHLISQVVAELRGENVNQEQAAALVILESLSTLTGDTQACWLELQKLRLLADVPETVRHLCQEIETLDLELSRAGEQGAVFKSVAEGVQFIKGAATRFVEHSTVRLLEQEGKFLAEVRIPSSLVAELCSSATAE
jgi:hypothetical protein